MGWYRGEDVEATHESLVRLEPTTGSEHKRCGERPDGESLLHILIYSLKSSTFPRPVCSAILSSTYSPSSAFEFPMFVLKYDKTCLLYSYMLAHVRCPKYRHQHRSGEPSHFQTSFSPHRLPVAYHPACLAETGPGVHRPPSKHHSLQLAPVTSIIQLTHETSCFTSASFNQRTSYTTHHISRLLSVSCNLVFLSKSNVH